jgi:hypothetical protein
VQNLNVLQVFRAETWSRLQKAYERNAITATFFGEGRIFQPLFFRSMISNRHAFCRLSLKLVNNRSIFNWKREFHG